MSTTCQARKTADGQMRCAACRLAWDYGDAPPCPRVQAPPIVPELPTVREPFASGLPRNLYERI